MKLPKYQLAHQLLGGFAVSLLAVGVVSLSITYTTLRQNLQHQIQQRARGITQGLEFATEGLIEDKEVFLLERIVQNYATLPTVIEISIVSPDGNLLAHSRTMDIKETNTKYASLHPELASFAQQASQSGIEKNIQTVIKGKHVVVQILPFSSTLFQKDNTEFANNQGNGIVIAIMNLQEMEEEALQNTSYAIYLMIFSLGLMLAFMAWLLRKLVLSPLTKMTLAVSNSQKQGNLTLPAMPNNEIGFLGDTFASVFEQLKTYKQREMDIVEKKYAEVAQRYELATRAAKVWVWDWDITTDYFVMDSVVREWLGYTQSALPVNLASWLNYIYTEDRSLFLKNLQNHLDGNSPEFNCEHRLMDVDGNLQWFLSRGQAFTGADNKAIRAIGTITDINDIKHYEAQLQQTNQELARATRLKDEFLANMSHELRTPLNAILGMTEGLQDQVFGTVSTAQIESLRVIERSSSHLLSLINDILDVAKIESGQLELDYSSTNVALLCQSSLAFVKQQALSKSIQLEVKIPRYIPELQVDERRIRQVLINLLNNAVKFTPQGGRITLEVRLQDSISLDNSTSAPHDKLAITLPQKYLCIDITDTGIGIAPENINRLFQPFMQIDSALNRQYEGTGLGLALVKRLVEVHGGKVSLRSQEGVGSCFTIALPCNNSYQEENNPIFISTQDVHTASTDDTPEAMPLILLAEDNDANVVTISSYLKAKGYRMVLAQNGRDAIAMAKAEQPDLILMDVQMPIIDGLEATRQIRQIPALVNVPIVALTALAMTGDRERCIAAGANEYLSKPVKLKQLVKTIHQLLAT
ncbi:hybrid sensor histidine kinase/response regulator [Pseudanabaena mucicola]|nr:hybrid sensor histidine kinase/response regulator [Pseudanabaena mucicola]